MPLFTLFMSKKERERQARRERRHAFRDAENAVDAVKEQQKRLEKEAQKHLEAVRAAKKAGEKAAANRALVSYRAALTLAMKLEQKRWVFEQYLVKMETAQSDEQFASALAAINKVVHIDPDRVADVFDASQELLGEQLDADKFWNKLYDKEMAGAEGSLEDYIPSMEELDKQTDEEVAAEIGGAPAAAGHDIDASLAAGRERVKRILEGR